MFYIQISCYNQYDRFKPVMIGKSGPDANALLEWAGKKILPLIFYRQAGNEGIIEVILKDGKEVVAENWFEF